MFIMINSCIYFHVKRTKNRRKWSAWGAKRMKRFRTCFNQWKNAVCAETLNVRVAFSTLPKRTTILGQNALCLYFVCLGVCRGRRFIIHLSLYAKPAAICFQRHLLECRHPSIFSIAEKYKNHISCRGVFFNYCARTFLLSNIPTQIMLKFWKVETHFVFLGSPSSSFISLSLSLFQFLTCLHSPTLLYLIT